MKFLLALVLAIGSTVASANEEGWKVKCFDRGEDQELDLAYIIKVHHHKIKLLDCTTDEAKNGDCRFVGFLEREERQDETCLELSKTPMFDGSRWSLCHEEQENLVGRRLVPVTVTDDRQESRIFCERRILKLL